MDKDNEIYVISNGELYKKGVEQAIYPQTNYTIQQFYTKEEYDKLQAENERLKSIVESNNQQVEQAELLVMDNDRLQQEVENLKDTIYYDVEKYRQALQEIREMVDCANCEYESNNCNPEQCSKIEIKINEVIGAEQIG